mmetsp:Transcript_9847/g.17250  ORF Transcript_9847/g.17250 Transcript_9847/m.17250 type:complete len:217 (-) Transcript_9847:270-920(-)|eukprot:CAMPEP_0183729554 /NCGR_PEP_ID=MMETSP0737-20130205/30604_1 /TAXON_ID=385413 /ORGANISM="Thalassiosira miniscula, Strain CCMP1093" /LENGTH=216 /DNA_ID=CAMNT_0025961775 /DNA_START=63 /DNA_END=713 /DNA_ORIENTATION=-
MTAIPKNTILATFLCCMGVLISEAPTAVADREVGIENEIGDETFHQNLRNERLSNNEEQHSNGQQHEDNHDDLNKNEFSDEAKNKNEFSDEAKLSLVYRSLILVSVFWTIKSLKSQIISWSCSLLHCIFRRKPKTRSRWKSKNSSGSVSTNLTTSSSILDIIAMADDTENEGSNILYRTKSFSSMSSLLGFGSQLSVGSCVTLDSLVDDDNCKTNN